MKVYVITSGEYSDYGIRAVALSREKAALICAMLNSTKRYYSDVATIEEYDTDEIQIAATFPKDMPQEKARKIMKDRVAKWKAEQEGL